MPMTARLDPAWLDAQYNSGARITDHADIFERWAEASALSRRNSVCMPDVRYGDAPEVTPGVFHTNAPHAPVLVFIHGGWWRALDKADHAFVAPSFSADGALMVMPNYSLCAAVTVEQITLQTVRALTWVWHNAVALDGDPRCIVVAGHSAGAHLAAMLPSCRWKEVQAGLPAQLLSGALAISGVFDLEPIRQTRFLQADLNLTPAAVRRLGPAFFPRQRGRLYAVAGADESAEFLRQNELIRDVRGPISVPVCERLAGHHHLSILNSLADPAGRLHELALRLLGLR